MNDCGQVKYSSINIVPMPKYAKSKSGNDDFSSCKTIEKAIFTKVKKWEAFVQAFITLVYKIHEVKFEFKEGGILLEEDPALLQGHYTFDTDDLKAKASSDEGIGYALSTILQLIRKEEKKVRVNKINDEQCTILYNHSGDCIINECEIYDYPESKYRGVMMDINPKHSLEDLLFSVDLCFLFKMNYLHIHFTDDYSYNLPTDVLPKLNQASHGFTKEQIKQLNDYALARNIIIVPEIDLPGHSQIFIDTYPEYFANVFKIGQEAKNGGGEMYRDNAICIGNPKSMELLKALVKEVCGLFPNVPYIHIGGDEARLILWEHCENCKAYMKEHGYEDASEMYAHVVKDLANIVINEGKRPIVWEGFPKKWLNLIPKQCIVEVFESYYCLADDLINNGFDVINCTFEPLYSIPWGVAPFQRDVPWGCKDILAWDIYTWKNLYFIDSPVHLNPMRLPPTEKVLGAQMCAWGGYFEQKLPYLREFVPATAERTWTIKRYCEDEQYLNKMHNINFMIDELVFKRYK